MMKLILLSKYFIKPAQSWLNKLTGKQNEETTLAFCSNAGDVYSKERRKYIGESREELSKSGFKLINLELNESLNDILYTLKTVDATYFTGGSFYHLKYLFDSSGLSEKYEKMLKKGLIHIGFSAGAMICSADFDAYDCFAKFKNEKVKSGLDLFPYYIIPHYFDKVKYTKAYEKVIKAGFKDVIPLTNNQAVLVDNNEWSLVQI